VIGLSNTLKIELEPDPPGMAGERRTWDHARVARLSLALRSALFASIALLAARPGAAALQSGDALVLQRDDLGLRLRRPDASWVAHVGPGETKHDEKDEGGGTLATISLYQPGSQGVPSVAIYVARHDGSATAAQAAEAGAAAIEAQRGTVLERGEALLAGRPAVRLHGRMDGADGLPYEFEMLYAVAPPRVYAVQSVWRADEAFPEALLRPLLDSIALVPVVSAPAPDPLTLQMSVLAERCASELPWAADWDAAAARARDEQRLVLVVFEHFAGLEVPQTRASGVLMDEDVAALIEERCVLLRLGDEDAAPFRDAQVWGMGPSSWGGVLLLVTPEGAVLEQTSHNSAFLLDELLRRALPRPPQRPLPRERDERLEQAALCLRRGELEHARELIGSADTAPAHRLRAALARRERRGDDALAELAAARRTAGDDAALLADIAVEEPVVLMRLGRWEEAEEAFRRALAQHPEGARSSEAEFWLGGVEMLRQGFPAGRERWRALAQACPDDRWAWKAAANVLDGGAFVNGAERPHWPEPSVFAAVAQPPAAPLKATQLAQAARDARDFLLAGQQPDGSWVSPMDAFGVTPSGYTFATTALCGSSLLPQRASGDAVELALRRAVHYLLAVREAGGLDGGTDLMGTYSIWSRVFALRFLAQARAAGLDGDGAADVPALDEAIAGLLQSVLDSQQPSGGWPYVVLAGTSAEQGFDGSASFLTAGVLIALIDARAAGVAVPQAPIGRGLDFLEGLRQEDGTFRYFAGIPETPGDPEAAGRGPVCELALLRGGVGGLPGLRRALDAFDDQRSVFRREWGKELCHTGAQGQGAHYLLYDWSFAASAAALLPRSERSRWRRELLSDLLAVRDAEGAYADMPSLGRAYGTAMALSAFEALSAP
jgi:tetratricopeptide (TPR) repeat protein